MPSSALATALLTFKRTGGWLREFYLGRHALIEGEGIHGYFESPMDAVRAGFQRFGAGPFLVKQIRLDDEPVQIFCQTLEKRARPADMGNVGEREQTMPCFITGSEIGDRELSAETLRSETQKLTRMLCALCHRIEEHGELDLLPGDVRHWWTAHRESDRERLIREALAKLSEEEIEALGFV